MLGTFVVLYLFLGGCGAAVLLVTAWGSLVARFRLDGPSVSAEAGAFRRLRMWLYLVGLLMLGLAALFLLLDLGRPQLFWLLFVRPTGSLLSLGTFLLSAALLVAVFLLVDAAVRPCGNGTVRKVAEALLCALASGVMVYTGLYMACLESVPLWNNPAIPVLFALSSLSSGLSCALVVTAFTQDSFQLEASVRRLHRIHGAVLAAEAAALAVFLIVAWQDVFARPGLAALLSPQGLGQWFLAGFLAAGLAVPLAAEAACIFGRVSAVIPAELLCVLGGLVLRFCVVFAA